MFDFSQFALLAAHSRTAPAAENLFLRKQLALFQERKVGPRRADDATPWLMVTLSYLFPWRGALVNVKVNTFIGWHRRGFRLFWQWKSKSTGRPRLPKDLRQLIREMAAENPIWGEERIADELNLKLGLVHAMWPECPARISPDGQYLLVNRATALISRGGEYACCV